MKIKRDWIKTEQGNSCLSYDDFYISYNPDIAHSMAIHPMGFLQKLGEALGNDPAGEETALTNNKTGKFFILNGDFRKEYEACGDSFSKCMEVFNKHKGSHFSKWSSEPLEETVTV